MKIYLRVWLKTPDAEAATVKNTLKKRLGYESVLLEVEREILWTIEVSSVDDPLLLAGKFARELVNENKEWCSTSVGDILLSPGSYVPVKVALNIEDGWAKSTMNCLIDRLGFDMIRSVERAVIWKLYIDGPDPKSIAKEMAEDLLVNPNKDSYQILSTGEGP